MKAKKNASSTKPLITTEVKENEKVEVSKFQILLETVRLGSITKAANQLNYTQSGLTYLLNTVETELGFPILERTYSGVRLNREGKELEPFIRELVRQETLFQAEVYRIRGIFRGKISVYVIHSLANTWLPELIAGFKQEQPNMYINVHVTSGSRIYEAVKSGEADFGIVDSMHADGMKWYPLFQDQICAAIPKNWDFPQECESITVEDLLDKTLLFPASNLKNVGAEVMMDKGVQKRMYVSANDSMTLINMVSSGLGFAMVSELYAGLLPTNGAGVRLMPMSPGIYRSLGIIRLPDKRISPMVRAFMDYIMEVPEIENCRKNILSKDLS